jgi:hypothetical protein
VILRRQFVALAALLFCAPLAQAKLARGGAVASGGGGATQVFTYPNFTSTSGLTGSWENTTGGIMQICGNTVHDAGQVWRTTKQNIQSFATSFNFSVGPGTGSPQLIGYGVSFSIQNDVTGTGAQGDSNGLGFGQYAPPSNPLGTATQPAVTIAFNSTPNNGTGSGWFGTDPSATGMYLNGGPYLDNGLSPTQDLIPQGINLWSGHLYNAFIVYDGTILSLLLTDTTTGAIAYEQWPVDIPTIVGGDTAYIGFGAGAGENSPATPQTLNSWTWWSGYNERLASPTFSVTPGQYTSTQSVGISGPAGASIYYTVNGQPPTPASTLYTGAVSISSSAILQAVAVESNWSDSFPTVGDYQIQASGLPQINYPSGFTADGRISLNGMTTLASGALQLTDSATVDGAEVGSAFYNAPVSIAVFSGVFEFQFTGSSDQNGLAFIFQNVIPSSVSSTTTGQLASIPSISGGPNALGFPVYGASDIGAGYAGIQESAAMVFDGWNNKLTEVTNGTMPNGTGTTPTGITLDSGHVIKFTYSYNGTVLTYSVEDMTTTTIFNGTWTVNIPSAVGASTAYVGFSASVYSTPFKQTVTNWTYNP